MSYYFSTTIQTTFEDAVTRVTEELQKEGFGVLTVIDVMDTLKKKLNVDFRKYVILGACNPGFAYEALQKEDKIGTMLPCNVIVQEIPGVGAEVAAVDPVASMQAVESEPVRTIATQVREKLKRVLGRLR
ncbi:MAG: hypothetical protein A2010_08850 [Nitrospirae bacterium GWD2_57_9]|nr:MAG: hypothetical protein A2010_08850 [Nitrospirae bacterium GWD2_57_9]OGW49244.1 MAG: hypothetical protein A2078_07680 [Nitrospirae bacterium GWC2_57_9]